MSEFRRYAIYHLPDDPGLAAFGAAWLGWDVTTGTPADHLPVAIDLPEVTATPRKYGFHATLKPPFRLSDGETPEALSDTVARLAAGLRPVRLDGLRVASLGHFVALVPQGDVAELNQLAFRCVRDLDAFRAAPTDAELAKRRAAGLSPAQDRLLLDWGYPYVGDEFHFHMTLSGRLDATGLAVVQSAAEAAIPDLPAPYVIGSVALVAELHDGMFQLIQRYALTG